MAAPCSFNVFVGAETGLLKGVNTEKRTFVNLNGLQEVNRDLEVTCLRWNDESESEIYAALRSQVVKVYCPTSGVCKNEINVTGGSGPVKGLGIVNSNLVTCVSSGLLRVWNEDLEKQAEREVGNDIFRMRQHSTEHQVVATGGKENDLKLWNLERLEQPIFQAKNVKNDFLDLRMPVWVTDMQFLRDSEKVAVVTGHHQIRVYDPSCRQRRPVIDFEFDEYPLTCLSLTSRSEQIVVGNTQGRVALVDLRLKRMIHVFRGFAGSTRDVVCHPTLPIVASCGLDRFLRVHDLHSRTLVTKMYLKSRLNCILIRTDFSTTEKVCEDDNSDTAKEAEEQEEDNEMWEAMEEVNETKDVEDSKQTARVSRKRTSGAAKKHAAKVKKCQKLSSKVE
uniref:Uncharacterized protein n=1 Tax=Ornithodoros turicata TaxID=34597 RepID=A0A2R5LJX0_9ACAR